MNTIRILGFLNDIAANNNRDWFQEHKLEYETVKKDFDQGVGIAIKALSTIDNEISHVQVKDCTYRFYRDIRFSPDKSPYKRHFGAYICAKGARRCVEDITYMYNLVIVWWLLGLIGCQPTF